MNQIAMNQNVQSRSERPASANLPFAATTPVSVAAVGLKSANARRLADYYRSVVGLNELQSDGQTIVLGAGERPLLTIDEDRELKPDSPRLAGLFHTAFLLPERADLGRWINRAIEKQIRITGASDHIVSEAVYLDDPDGNGIEIYVDRDRDGWRWNNGLVEMSTARMNVPGVQAAVPENDANWRGAPDNMVVGHVHLRVGDPQEAEEWWNSEMRFDTVARYGADAVFMSTGGYHHHIATNAWGSRGATTRDAGVSGLNWIELQSADAKLVGQVVDPWGTTIRTIERSI